jgi:RNA recognition motif-containing protein
MFTTLFVGNFPFETTQSELMAVFTPFGRVESIKLINDRLTGRPRGFGFVKIEKTAAKSAITALHRSEFGGRPLNVRDAGPVRREITLAEGKGSSSSLELGRESDLFVQDYWLNNDPQVSPKEKRSYSSSNIR